jgi:multiple sugar transport system substrate-binding protein
MKRRQLLVGAAAALVMPALAMPALTQTKPDKLVFVGDNGPWHWTLVEEVAPEFEKASGIKVDFTLLPGDALSARLKAELNSGTVGIDVIQWGATSAGWLAPYMADHETLLEKTSARHPDFDWDDFLPAVRDMASYKGKLLGIPYRATASILHYQKPLLDAAGIPGAPGNWDEFLAACLAINQPPQRHALGIWGRQGPAIVGGFAPFLHGFGGEYFDRETWETLINNDKAVEALRYYGDLMTRYKVIVPDAITWEFDEGIAGGQRDRYGMMITLAPYGTLLNDPKISRTAGNWAWSVPPGRHSAAESRTSLGGWTLGVPKEGKNQEWAFEFIQLACSKRWMQRSLERGNAPPRVSVLNTPAVAERFGWAPVLARTMRTAMLEPRDPIWPSMELRLREAISAVLLGEKSAKVALDGVAADWQRTLKRARRT